MLRGRHFLKLEDFTKEELYMILDTADDLKRKLYRGEPHEMLRGKTIGLIFNRLSTRTRVSFETGMTQLGGHAQYLFTDVLQVKRGEPIKDTARVISRYVDGIMLRADLDTENEMVKYSRVPVISGSSGFAHPCQVTADLLTIREKKKHFEGLKLAIVWGFCSSWTTLPPTVCHDFIFAGPKLGMEIVIACPEGYQPYEKAIMDRAKSEATKYGGSLKITNDMEGAVEGADIIYNKKWIPWGFPKEEKPDHLKDGGKFRKWIVNKDLVEKAKDDVIVMNPLPAFREEEITDEVIEGPHSVVFDEAENRIHAEKAIMALVMW